MLRPGRTCLCVLSTRYGPLCARGGARGDTRSGRAGLDPHPRESSASPGWAARCTQARWGCRLLLLAGSEARRGRRRPPSQSRRHRGAGSAPHPGPPRTGQGEGLGMPALLGSPAPQTLPPGPQRPSRAQIPEGPPCHGDRGGGERPEPGSGSQSRLPRHRGLRVPGGKMTPTVGPRAEPERG